MRWMRDLDSLAMIATRHERVAAALLTHALTTMGVAADVRVSTRAGVLHCIVEVDPQGLLLVSGCRRVLKYLTARAIQSEGLPAAGVIVVPRRRRDEPEQPVVEPEPEPSPLVTVRPAGPKIVGFIDLAPKAPADPRPSFWAHAEAAQRRVDRWPAWKREAARETLVPQPTAPRREDPADDPVMRALLDHATRLGRYSSAGVRTLARASGLVASHVGQRLGHWRSERLVARRGVGGGWVLTNEGWSLLGGTTSELAS